MIGEPQAVLKILERDLLSNSKVRGHRPVLEMLEGRTGGFVLVHRGTMTKAGSSDLQVIVAPDSGTGGLMGITGVLKIRVEGGKHYYDIDYTLSAS